MPKSKIPSIARFAEKYCRHTKGRFAGKPFILLPWQQKILTDIFETFDDKGMRQYKSAYIEVPKKSGKTQLAALIGLYMLIVDPEPEAEIYSCAVDREQASLSFNAAKSMVQANPLLDSKITITKYMLEYKGSKFSPRARESKSAHGINPSCLILDELHVWPGTQGREYFDALTAGDVNRAQPITIMITTAGNDQNSVCWQQHEYARQVREGVIDDPNFYSYIAGCAKEDDWTSPETWTKANPSLGHTITMASMERKCREAENSPAKQNAFRQLHLNQWVQQAERWLDLKLWDKCDSPVEPEELAGRRCFGGLDLASRIDLTAFVLMFPPEELSEPWKCLPYFWMPEDGLHEKGLKDQVPYLDWVRDGYLMTTPGNICDYKFIQETLKELGDKYQILQIGYDPWNAVQLAQELQDAEGFDLIEVRQGHRSMNAPSKELLSLITDGKFAHGGHPILRWMADNVVVRLDANGNIAPDKKKARQKIDGIVATIIALGRCMDKDETRFSVYETQDLLVL